MDSDFATLLIVVFAFSLFFGLCFLVALAVDRFQHWIQNAFKGLFTWRNRGDKSGMRDVDALVEEANIYAHDWRLFTVACVAKFAKVDGVVTKNELQVVERLFETLCLTGELRPLAIRTFQQAKNGSANLQDCMRVYRELYKEEPRLSVELLAILFDVAHSDGVPSERTRQALVEICQQIGLDAQECFDTYTQHHGQAKRTDMEAAYTVLGCQPTDTLGVIKDRYRKLVKDYHPDTLSGKNLAPDFLQFAEERFKQIQAAYEAVMAARGATQANSV